MFGKYLELKLFKFPQRFLEIVVSLQVSVLDITLGPKLFL
jgi:hypothetical protein